MEFELFMTESGGLDEKIEALVARRMRGDWTEADQVTLDRLIAKRGSSMIRYRKSGRRYA